MKKHFLPIVATSLFILSCSNKDSTPNPTPKTKTQLLTQNSWKFKSATVGGADASSYLQPCQIDNILTFISNGTGTGDEGPLKCNGSDPQTYPITWNFASSETILHTASPLFTNGTNDFTINSLTETELILQMPYNPPVGASVIVVVTFQH